MGAMTTEAISTVHLLVGYFENVGIGVGQTVETPNPIQYARPPGPITQFSYDENIIDGTSCWGSVGRNGSISTAENAWSLMSLDPAEPVNFRDSFRMAREFAQSAQTMGGR